MDMSKAEGGGCEDHGKTENANVGGESGGFYSRRRIGLGDTIRLDSELYTEPVDFDFFDETPKKVSTAGPAPTSSSSSSSNGFKSLAMLTENGNKNPDEDLMTEETTDESHVFAPIIANNDLLQVQVVGQNEQIPAVGVGAFGGEAQKQRMSQQKGIHVLVTNDQIPPFSTSLLMAALPPNGDQSQSHSPGHASGGGQTPPPRVHLFDLTDSDDEDEDEAELAQINNGMAHSWNQEDYYFLQHIHQQAKRARKNGGNGGLEAESSDEDEEGYYLSDSERSDITEVTPMSSVPCSPMPPFGGNHSAGGTPYPHDDSFDGFPINRGDSDEDDADDELGAIMGKGNSMDDGNEEACDDDRDIDEILRVIPSSAPNANSVLEMQETGGLATADGDCKAATAADQYIKSVASKLQRHMSDGNGQTDENGAAKTADNLLLSMKPTSFKPLVEMGTDLGAFRGPAASGGAGNCSSGNGSIAGGSGQSGSSTLLTVNHSNNKNSAAINIAEAQRKKMLASHHPHHNSSGSSGGGSGHHQRMRLNRVQHNHNNHPTHGGPRIPGVHQHRHLGQPRVNFHTQYHTLTMTLHKKRLNQQKEIDRENAILKERLEKVKPSDEIQKAFGGSSSSGSGGSASGSATTPTKAPTSTLLGLAYNNPNLNINNNHGVTKKSHGSSSSSSSTASSITASSSASYSGGGGGGGGTFSPSSIESPVSGSGLSDTGNIPTGTPLLEECANNSQN